MNNAISRFTLVLCVLAGSWFTSACGVCDELKVTRDGVQKSIMGELVVQAQDGGIMFRGEDGRIWVLDQGEYDSVDENDDPFKGLDQDAIAARLLEELPEGFEVHQTKNYVIAYNTSKAYAKWVGALYERLFKGFQNYWKTKKFRLTNPDVPLTVVVFASKENYTRYATSDLGQNPGTMVAYYNLISNRVAMYDLTGGQTGAVRNLSSSKQINAMLSQPRAAAMVATVVHEATHQLMFNRGMQQRLADTPLWVNEGMAVFFETPDLKSSTGWRSIGKINVPRLMNLRLQLRNRPNDSLMTLISDDARFRDPAMALNAYAEAWALNYFLLRRYHRNYVKYLRELSEKKPLRNDEPSERVELFEKYFGPLDELEKEFVKYASRLKN